MDEPDFVHRFVPGETSNDRVLLLLHGTGGDESDLLPLGRELDPKAALLSPRGRVLENGAPRFFRRFAEGVFDEEDVLKRAHELADFVAAAAAKYAFAPERVIAVGYSNGANIAAAMMLLRPEALAAAILFRAMVPLAKPPSADLAGKRVLLSAGQADPIIPLANVQRLRQVLTAASAEVTLKIQASNHALVPADLTVARGFLNA